MPSVAYIYDQTVVDIYGQTVVRFVKQVCTSSLPAHGRGSEQPSHGRWGGYPPLPPENSKTEKDSDKL